MRIEILIFLLLAAAIIGVECFRTKRTPYDVLFLFNLSYFIYFVLAPLHIVAGGEAFTRQSWTYQLVGSGGVGPALWVFCSYLLVLVGYWAVPSFRSPLRFVELKQVCWTITGIMCVGIGVAAFFLYAQSVGGVSTAITQASFIRQGEFKVSGSLLFGKHLVPLVISGLMITFATRLDLARTVESRSSLTLRWVFLVMIVVVLVGVVVAGRRAILFPIVVLFFVLGNVSRKHNAQQAALIMSGAIAILAFWDVVGWGLRDQQWATYFANRMTSAELVYAIAFRPISDSYMHWVGVLNQNTELWAFKDWLYLPFYILPSFVMPGIDPPSVVDTTTVMFKGQGISETAGEPPGFHGYLYMSGGALGVVVGSLFYGCLLRIFHLMFSPSSNSARQWLVYVWVALGLVYFLRHGMIEFVISERFHWWATLGILCGISLLLGVRLYRPRGIGSS